MATRDSGLLTGEAVDALVDLAGDRRRGRATGAGLLDHGDDDVLGVVGWCEGGEPRGVLFTGDLRGARLSRDDELGAVKAGEGSLGRTALRGVGDPGQRLADIGEGGWVDGELALDDRRDRRDRRPVSGQQRLAEARLVKRATVGEGAVGRGQL